MATKLDVVISGDAASLKQAAAQGVRSVDSIGPAAAAASKTASQALGATSGSAANLKQAAAQAQQALGGIGPAGVAAGKTAGQALAAGAGGGQALARGAREAGRALDQTGTAAERALGKLAGMGHLGVGVFAFNRLAQAARDAVSALWQAGVEAQRTRNLLNFATAGQGAQALRDVGAMVDRLGLSLTETAAAYAKFQAAARGTRLEGQGARQVFEAVAEASAVMGLSAADTGGVLLALQQMVSKGTVSAEELRGQLGERLPGAFQIAARAMGVTTAELGKMLEQGQVVADEFLPRFGAQLHKELGGAAEAASQRLEASLNRLDNAWERLKRQMADAGAAQGAVNVMSHVERSLQAASDAMAEFASSDTPIENIARGTSVAMGALSGLGYVAADAFGTVADRTQTAQQRVQALQAEVDVLASHGVRIPYRDAELRRATADLEYLLALKSRLEGGAPVAVAADVRKADAKLQAEAEEQLARARLAVADATQKAAGVSPDYIKGLAAISALQAADPAYDPTADATALAEKYGKSLVDAHKSAASEAAQLARAQAEATLATQRAASDARLRSLAQQMAGAARLREQDLLSGQQWADAQVALLRQVEAEQLAQNQRAQQALQAQTPKDAADAARQLAELARLRGEAQRITDDAVAAEAKAVDDGYADAARAFEQAAGDLRQAAEQARGQIRQTSDINAQLAIERIADPVARATALAAWQVRRSREETEREIRLLEARIAAFRAAGGDNALDIGAAESAIDGLRIGQRQTEAAINLRLADETQPEFRRLLTDWADTTRQMRQTWDGAITQMTDGAADAFGRFISGQQVSLQQLAQQMLYTLGRGLFQQFAGQAASALGLTAPTPQGGKGGGAASSGSGSDEASAALAGSAAAISGAAQDSSGALGSAAAQLIQSALGWLLPQSAQTAAAVTLTSAALALTGAATLLSTAAVSLGAQSAAEGVAGMAAMFARRGATYGVTPFAAGGAFQRGG